MKDILQNTFLKLYKNIDKLPNDDIQIKKWLIRVASNGSKDFLRSFWHSRIEKIDDSLEYGFSMKDNNVILILKKVPKKYRLVIFLFYYEGYMINEISDILNISESTVKIRLMRARDKIKKEMER